MLLHSFGGGARHVSGQGSYNSSGVYGKGSYASRLESAIYFIGKVGIGKLRLAIGRPRVILRVFRVEVVEVDCAISVARR